MQCSWFRCKAPLIDFLSSLSLSVLSRMAPMNRGYLEIRCNDQTSHFNQTTSNVLTTIGFDKSVFKVRDESW